MGEASRKLKVTLEAMHGRRMLDQVALQRADFAISDLPAHANGVLLEQLRYVPETDGLFCRSRGFCKLLREFI
jgi:hypothetical protein